MYHEFTPCAALVPFIDKFWVFKGFTDIGTRFKILADGCTDFIFSIGNMTYGRAFDDHATLSFLFRWSYAGLFGSDCHDKYPAHAGGSFSPLWAGSFHE